MDSDTTATLEEVRDILEGYGFKSTKGSGSSSSSMKEIILKKTLGLDTKHIEGMIHGAKILEIGHVKYIERAGKGARVSYPIKFEEAGEARYGALRVAFQASLQDGIELTFVVVDKGPWKEKSEKSPPKKKSKSKKKSKETPLQSKLKSMGYGKKRQ